MIIPSKHIAKIPDANGFVNFSPDENQVWHDLFVRQQSVIVNRASDEFIEGIALLNMAADHIPQVSEMNTILKHRTGWQVEPVPALIPNELFFELLAQKKFPAATFIRHRDELDYLEEPDIFHEYFGHCTMLTDQAYADFTENYAKKTLSANEIDRTYLGRLYWFTIEFGLMNTLKGLRIYGGGILSSKSETIYAVESPIPQRLPFGNGLDALRTPYRIDIMQPIYYIIENYNDLYNVMQKDLFGLIHQAQDLGDFAPLFDTHGAKSY